MPAGTSIKDAIKQFEARKKIGADEAEKVGAPPRPTAACLPRPARARTRSRR